MGSHRYNLSAKKRGPAGQEIFLYLSTPTSEMFLTLGGAGFSDEDRELLCITKFGHIRIDRGAVVEAEKYDGKWGFLKQTMTPSAWKMLPAATKG